MGRSCPSGRCGLLARLPAQAAPGQQQGALASEAARGCHGGCSARCARRTTERCSDRVLTPFLSRHSVVSIAHRGDAGARRAEDEAHPGCAELVPRSPDQCATQTLPEGRHSLLKRNDGPEPCVIRSAHADAMPPTAPCLRRRAFVPPPAEPSRAGGSVHGCCVLVWLEQATSAPAHVTWLGRQCTNHAHAPPLPALTGTSTHPRQCESLDTGVDDLCTALVVLFGCTALSHSTLNSLSGQSAVSRRTRTANEVVGPVVAWLRESGHIPK